MANNCNCCFSKMIKTVESVYDFIETVSDVPYNGANFEKYYEYFCQTFMDFENEVPCKNCIFNFVENKSK